MLQVSQMIDVFDLFLSRFDIHYTYLHYLDQLLFVGQCYLLLHIDLNEVVHRYYLCQDILHDENNKKPIDLKMQSFI